jgi:hypothetical protein|tara:strand:- start:1600 stop:1950 length:351 start_codon:yes stop_codon:yes gene_type:complete
MNVSLEKVTNFLKPFLLKNIIIKTDKKILKRGRLKIFQVKQYYINLTLEYNGANKSYEIPYPYTTEYDEDIGILNYHLSSFIPNKQINKVKCLDSSSKSKIYNNLVYILTSEEDNI